MKKTIFAIAACLLSQAALADQASTGPVGVNCRKAIYSEALGAFMNKNDVSQTEVKILGLAVAGYVDNAIGVIIGTSANKSGYSEVAVTLAPGSSNFNLLTCSVVAGSALVP